MKTTLITDTAALEIFCREMAAEPFVALDTEFIREKTYWPQLCLVQVAGADHAAAIDPLAEGISLAPLLELLARKEVLKVLHAARQDLEIFFKMTGEVPAPVFDTQVAAQVCGLGESVGYEALVQRILNQKLDKSQRFTDWSRRPLSAAQLEYALGDVIYLHAAYQKLLADIQKRGREHWLAEDMAVLADPALYHTHPEDAWQRIRFRASHPRQLGRLQRLAQWREELAQGEDIPRTRVMRDETLAELATNLPASEAEMVKIRSFPQHLKKEWRTSLWPVIEAARNLAKEECPPLPKHKPLPPEAEGKLEMLRLLLRQACRIAEVSPRLVADKEELEWLARGGREREHPVLHGWRYEIFGEKALALLDGALAIAVDPQNGEILFRSV